MNRTAKFGCKVLNYGKYSLAKFAEFVYFVFRADKLTTIERESFEVFIVNLTF